MRRFTKLLFTAVLGIVVIASGSGCERGTAPPYAAGDRISGQSAGGGGVPLTVVIRPEDPTASADLRADCSHSSDPSVRYSWELNGQLLPEEQGGTLQGRGRLHKGDSVTVFVSAAGTTASATAVIANMPPVIISVALQPELIYRGIDITAVPTARDDDGDEVRYRYRWAVNGNELPGDSAVLKGDRFHRKDRISLVVTPYDADGEGAAMASREIEIPNGPPRFTSVPLEQFQSENYVYQAAAVDPDGDPLAYALLSSPDGMSIDQKSGTVSLRIRKEHTGAHKVEIEAQDPLGAKASQSFTLNLTIP